MPVQIVHAQVNHPAVTALLREGSLLNDKKDNLPLSLKSAFRFHPSKFGNSCQLCRVEYPKASLNNRFSGSITMQQKIQGNLIPSK